MKLQAVNFGFFKLDGGAMFGVVPKSIWDKSNPADEGNLCTWATRSLLIEDGNRLILIDTGLGDKQDERFFRHYHRQETKTPEQALHSCGYHPDEVTDVILTHLHFDHVGGAVQKRGDELLPTFRNALYWTNKTHWHWALKPNAREKASFLKENLIPLETSGQLRFIPEQDGYAFTDQICMRFAYGHTEAMMLPEIRYADQTILYMADLLPSIGHIPIPYVMSYDVFPMKTMCEKELILREAYEGNYLLFLEHDPVYAACTLKEMEKGIRLADAYSSWDELMRRS